MTPASTPPLFFDRLLILLLAIMIVASTAVCLDDMQRARTSKKNKGGIFDESILDDIDQEFSDLVKRAQDEADRGSDDEPTAPAADYQNLSESENLSQSIEDIKKGF